MSNYVIPEDIILKKALKFSDTYSCGVYFLIDNGKIVYVGRTNGGFRRIIEHRKWKKFDSFSFFPQEKDCVNESEEQNIAFYKPFYNKKLGHGIRYDRKLKIFTDKKPIPKKYKIKEKLNGPSFGKKKNVYIKETLKEFDSMKKMSVFLGVSVSAISHALKRGTKCCGFNIKQKDLK